MGLLHYMVGCLSCDWTLIYMADSRFAFKVGSYASPDCVSRNDHALPLRWVVLIAVPTIILAIASHRAIVIF